MLSPNVTGGLFWHWQAWRSQADWKPTVEALEVWLKQQTKETRSDALVIIGASAGWMMPIGWLCQFKEVHTFDIDPLAAPLFKWRHGKKLRSVGTALTCHTQNALSDLPSLLCDILVATQGGRNPAYQEADGQRVMKEAEILVRIALGRGKTTETVYTCDFSHEYVSINADYRS